VLERGVWNCELLLYFTHDHTSRMSREEKLHHPQTRLSGHGGKHVGVLGNTFAGFRGFGRPDGSILLEI
jgi:hypothetical protein